MLHHRLAPITGTKLYQSGMAGRPRLSEYGRGCLICISMAQTPPASASCTMWPTCAAPTPYTRPPPSPAHTTHTGTHTHSPP